jgi:hypothetical protein
MKNKFSVRVKVRYPSGIGFDYAGKSFEDWLSILAAITNRCREEGLTPAFGDQAENERIH